jgi:hypothetical protein
LTWHKHIPHNGSGLTVVHASLITAVFESSTGRRFGARYADVQSSDRLGEIDASIQEPQKMASRAVLCCGLRLCSLVLFLTTNTAAQTTTTTQVPAQPSADAGTSTDFFLMPGSDFDRPGLVPRANLNIGIGHTFGFLKKDPVGDELTFAYTYENAGSHGFFHTNFGSHTEALGVMKNFGLPKTKMVTGYTWIQAGLTSFTGNSHVENRSYDGEALGAAIHFNDHNGIWIQESFNKIPTVPWYTTTGIGYTWSW